MADRDTAGGGDENVDEPFDDYESTSAESAEPEVGSEGSEPHGAELDGTRGGDAAFDLEHEDDISAMRGDDALLDALGGAAAETADSVDEQELNELLLAWRRDIDSEPMAELVDTDTAVTTIRTAAVARRHNSGGRKRKALVPVAVAAAVLAIAFTGTGLAARSAEPGDALWGLSQVLYTEHAQSVQAAASVRVDLEQADVAIAHGRLHRARQALESAAKDLTKVEPEDDLESLRAQHQQLSRELQQPGDNKDSTQGTSVPGESKSSSTTTTSPDEESSSSEPSDTELPPESTSTTRPESSSPTTTTTPGPSTSESTSGGESGTSDFSPKLDSQEPQSPAAPAN